MPGVPVPYHEQRIIELTANGDEQAFRMLYERYHHLLGRHIFRLTKSGELAEEIVQDTFLTIWRQRAQLTSVRDFKNFLFVISKNAALNALKAQARRHLQHQEWQDSLVHGQYASDTMAPLYEALDEAIRRLPPQQQRVYVLSRQHRMKYAEIAEKMDLSTETVKKYLKHANKSIINHLKSYNGLPEIGLLIFFLIF